MATMSNRLVLIHLCLFVGAVSGLLLMDYSLGVCSGQNTRPAPVQYGQSVCSGSFDSFYHSHHTGKLPPFQGGPYAYYTIKYSNGLSQRPLLLSPSQGGTPLPPSSPLNSSWVDQPCWITQTLRDDATTPDLYRQVWFRAPPMLGNYQCQGARSAAIALGVLSGACIVAMLYLVHRERRASRIAIDDERQYVAMHSDAPPPAQGTVSTFLCMNCYYRKRTVSLSTRKTVILVIGGALMVGVLVYTSQAIFTTSKCNTMNAVVNPHFSNLQTYTTQSVLSSILGPGCPPCSLQLNGTGVYCPPICYAVSTVQMPAKLNSGLAVVPMKVIQDYPYQKMVKYAATHDVNRTVMYQLRSADGYNTGLSLFKPDAIEPFPTC